MREAIISAGVPLLANCLINKTIALQRLGSQKKNRCVILYTLLFSQLWWGERCRRIQVCFIKLSSLAVRILMYISCFKKNVGKESLVTLYYKIYRNMRGLTRHYSNVALTLRRLMSYIYGTPILDVSRSHTTTQHSR